MPDASSELSTDHLMAGLGARSIRGGIVTVGAQAFKLLLQTVTIVILARLLPPSAFGLIAMVAALNTMLDLVKELGLSAATIRKPDLTQAEITALFWINAAAGGLITAALFAGAPLIAVFYNQPELTAMTRWLSLGFLLSGLTVQHWALLRRQMRFTAAVTIDTGGEIVAFAVAIILARAGAGYWALVAQRLTASALVLIGSWSLCAWRPGAPRRTAGVNGLLRFGLSVTGVNIAAAISRSIDQILVGWLWGANTLGLYERAGKLLLTPLNNINAPLYAVAMPGLCRIDHQVERYRRAFCEILEKLAMIVVPGALFVAATADWVVRILLGPQWQAAVPLVICFAIMGAYQPLIQAVGLLYLTQSRSREMVRAAMIDAILCVMGVIAGLPFGVTFVAASLAVVGAALRAPVAFWLSSRRGPVSLGNIVGAIAPSVAAGVATTGVVVALRRIFLNGDLPATEALAVSIGVALPAALAIFSVIPQSRRTLHGLHDWAQHLRGPTPHLND
jgi:PST family polysaccharide transporter